MSRWLRTPDGRAVRADGRAALEGCEPDCCGGVDPPVGVGCCDVSGQTCGWPIEDGVFNQQVSMQASVTGRSGPVSFQFDHDDGDDFSGPDSVCIKSDTFIKAWDAGCGDTTRHRSTISYGYELDRRGTDGWPCCNFNNDPDGCDDPNDGLACNQWLITSYGSCGSNIRSVPQPSYEFAGAWEIGHCDTLLFPFRIRVSGGYNFRGDWYVLIDLELPSGCAEYVSTVSASITPETDCGGSCLKAATIQFAASGVPVDGAPATRVPFSWAGSLRFSADSLACCAGAAPVGDPGPLTALQELQGAGLVRLR